MSEKQEPRQDPLAEPANLVSFPRVESLLARIFDELAPQKQLAFAAERDLVVGFLRMFPPGFVAPVPWPRPLDVTGDFYCQVTLPPHRWP